MVVVGRRRAVSVSGDGTTREDLWFASAQYTSPNHRSERAACGRLMGKRSAKDRQAGSSLAANQCATNKELAAVGVHAHDEPRRHPPTWFVCCMSILDCQCYLIPCEVLALIPLCVVAPYFIYHVVSTYITTNPFYCFASTAVVAACILMPWLYFVWAVYFCDQ